MGWSMLMTAGCNSNMTSISVLVTVPGVCMFAGVDLL